MTITKSIAQKVLKIVDAGLIKGQGNPIPGQLCVEAAVCLALGLPHGDNPPCVGSAVRDFKIALNDENWSSYKARAKGMRKLAVAQLGSDAIDQTEFTDSVCLNGVKRLLPIFLRRCAKEKNCTEPEKFLAHAKECEAVTTVKEAMAAAKSAYAYADIASRSASVYTYASASASVYASVYASAYAYASVYASVYASASASASVYASAYAYASVYASAYAYASKYFGEDVILNLIADIGLQALIKCKSPGCKFLSLCDLKPTTKETQ